MISRNSAIAFTIYALAFLGASGNPLILPLFPFFREAFQLSALDTGIFITVYGLPALFFVPAAGVLVDRLGRKPIIAAALILCIVSAWMCSQAQSFYELLLWRAVQGLAITPMEALSNTLIADNFSGPERMLHIGRNVSGMYVSVALFPLLSGGMLLFWSWRSVFFLHILFALPILLLCLRLPMRGRAEGAGWSAYFGEIRHSFQSRLLALFLVRLLLAFIMFGAIITYLPALLTDKLHASPYLVGPYFSLNSVCMTIASITLGRQLRHVSPRSLGMGAGMLLVAGTLLMMFTPSALLLPVSLMCCGTAIGCLTALTTAQVAATAQPQSRGAILALYATTFRGAQAFAPVLLGLIFSFGGFTPLLAAAAMLAVAIVAVASFAYEENAIRQR